MKKLFPLACTLLLTLALAANVAFATSTYEVGTQKLTLSADWSSATLDWTDADLTLDSGVILTLPTGTAIADIPFDQISGDGSVKVNGYSYNTSGTLIRFPALDFVNDTILENNYFTWDSENKTLTIKKSTDITGTLTLPAGATLILNADLQIRNYETGSGNGLGIDAKGALTITGSGELTVDTESNAIDVAGDLTVDGISATLTSRGGSAITTTGDVSLTDVDLYLGGWGYYGIDATGDLLISGEDTYIEDLSLQGIKATGDISISDGAKVDAYTVAVAADKSITLNGADTVLSAVPYTLDRNGTDGTYPDGYLTQTPAITDDATFNGWVESVVDTAYTYTLYGTTTFVPATVAAPNTTTLDFTTGATINLSTLLEVDYYSVTTEAEKSIYDYLTGDGLVVVGNEVRNTSGTLLGYSALDFTDGSPDYTAIASVEDTEDFYTWTKGEDGSNNILTIDNAMTMSGTNANCLTLPADTTLVLNADLTIDNGFENAAGEIGIYCYGALTVTGTGDLYIDTAKTALYSAGSLTVDTTGDWDITSDNNYGIQCNWQDTLTITRIGRLTVQSDSDCINGGSIALTLTEPATLTSTSGNGIEGSGAVTVNTDSTLSITAQTTNSASIYGTGDVDLSGKGTINANTHISSPGTVTVADDLSVNGWTQSSVTGGSSSVLSTKLDVYGNAVIPYMASFTQKITDTVTFHEGATLTISQGQTVNFAHVSTFSGDVNIINNGILKLAPSMQTTDTFNSISGSGYLWFDAETGVLDTDASTSYNNYSTVTDCRGNDVKAIVVGDIAERYDLSSTQYNDMETNGYTWTKSGTVYTLTFADDVALVLNDFEIGDLTAGDSIIINVPSDLLTGEFNINGAYDTIIQGDGTLTTGVFLHGADDTSSTLTIDTPITSIVAVKFAGNTIINAPVVAASLSATTSWTSSAPTLTIASTGSLHLTGEAIGEPFTATFTFHATKDGDTSIVPGLRLGEGIDVQLPTNANVQFVPYLTTASDTFHLMVMEEDVHPDSTRSNSASEIYIAAEPFYTPSGGISYFTSTLTTTEHGSVSLSGTRNTLNGVVTVTATPDDGYAVESVTVTYGNSREVSVTDNGDGTYSYKQPGATTTVTVIFTALEVTYENPFVDVDEGDYFYDAVKFAVENGITNGTSATEFSPDEGCTRAQAVMFLWNQAGQSDWGICYPYADVDADLWYTDAVYWARVNGIAQGVSEDYFAPEETCTRAQIITMLWNMAGQPVVNYLMDMEDVAEDAWYAEAVRWALSEGITTGTDTDVFSPDDTCTRAQIVTLLYRYLG